MLPVVWSETAESDLLEIVEYVWHRNSKAAHRLYDTIRESTNPVSEHPYIFRRSRRLQGCREIVVDRNYIVVYRVEKECIRVIRVVHGMRVHF